ncbi:MAG: VCBS domain-containing protein, partial [Deltaproteobacteria bacterium]|nr:VCBS domain-containing protein [Deltaproteobacteria bacterium]
NKELTLDNNWAENIKDIPVIIGVLETDEVQINVNGSLTENDTAGVGIELQQPKDGTNEIITETEFTVTQEGNWQEGDVMGTFWYDGKAYEVVVGEDGKGHVNIPFGDKGYDPNADFTFSATDKDGNSTHNSNSVHIDTDSTVQDVRSGEEGNFKGSITIDVIAVADAPSNVAGTSDVDEVHAGDKITITVTATFDDTDGSERHYVLVEAKDGWTCNGPHDVWTGPDGKNYFRVKVDGTEREVSEEISLNPPKEHDGKNYEAKLSVGGLAEEKATGSINDTGFTPGGEVSVTVTNEAPVLAAIDPAEVDKGASIGGVFVGTDADEDDILTYSVADAVADSSREGFDCKVAGKYGDLYYNSQTGAYEYVADRAESLAKGEKVDDSFVVTVKDNHGATGENSLQVTLTGANNAPTLEAMIADVDTGASIGGYFEGHDADAGDILTYSVTGALADDSRDGFDHKVAGEYGDLYYNSQTGAYEYVADRAESLAQDVQADESFNITVTDNDGATGENSLQITLTGAQSDSVTGASNPISLALVSTVSGQASIGEATAAAAATEGSSATLTVHGVDLNVVEGNALSFTLELKGDSGEAMTAALPITATFAVTEGGIFLFLDSDTAAEVQKGIGYTDANGLSWTYYYDKDTQEGAYHFAAVLPAGQSSAAISISTMDTAISNETGSLSGALKLLGVNSNGLNVTAGENQQLTAIVRDDASEHRDGPSFNVEYLGGDVVEGQSAEFTIHPNPQADFATVQQPEGIELTFTISGSSFDGRVSVSSGAHDYEVRETAPGSGEYAITLPQGTDLTQALTVIAGTRPDNVIGTVNATISLALLESKGGESDVMAYRNEATAMVTEGSSAHLEVRGLDGSKVVEGKDLEFTLQLVNQNDGAAMTATQAVTAIFTVQVNDISHFLDSGTVDALKNGEPCATSGLIWTYNDSLSSYQVAATLPDGFDRAVFKIPTIDGSDNVVGSSTFAKLTLIGLAESDLPISSVPDQMVSPFSVELLDSAYAMVGNYGLNPDDYMGASLHFGAEGNDVLHATGESNLFLWKAGDLGGDDVIHGFNLGADVIGFQDVLGVTSETSLDTLLQAGHFQFGFPDENDVVHSATVSVAHGNGILEATFLDTNQLVLTLRDSGGANVQTVTVNPADESVKFWDSSVAAGGLDEAKAKAILVHMISEGVA